MRKFSLSVHQYRQRLEGYFGYADPELVQRYANERSAWKRSRMGFNPFTQDPNCKSCGKGDGDK